MVRSQAADYGFELNEFDPFFNFRATQFLVDNGLAEYFAWHDDMSWYPQGRDISDTSQITLHVTAAFLYQIFGGDSLYDFVILFPVIFGSLTTIVIFALVRVLGGTTAGLFASLFFALSVPVIVRGTIGWFKSEPLGLFYGMIGVYLFLSGISSENKKVAVSKLVGGGLFLAFGLSAWGGIQFFVIAIGMFLLALPLMKKDLNSLLWMIPIFVTTLLLSAAAFPRPGISFVTGIGGFLILGPTAYMVASILIQRFSREKDRLRNGLIFLGGIIVAGFAFLSLSFLYPILPLPSFRYLNAVNPFLTTSEPLVDSVAEHATTTTAQSFSFLSILMVFAGVGIWLIFANREKLQKYMLKIPKEMVAFSLIFGILGVYISSAFIRLELFAAISVITLSSIGLAILASEIFKPAEKTRIAVSSSPAGKILFVAAVVALLLVPTLLPVQGNWVNSVKAPPTILNGGTNYNVANQDWLNSLEWIKNNTPEDAMVAAWWDYGYWITTMSNRTTYTDNATFSIEAIQNIARILLSSPNEAWAALNEMDADYFVLFIAANKIQNDPMDLYLLAGGGDESKKQWFMRIAEEEPVSKYLYGDGFSATPYFWENTMMGQMVPYSPLVYVDLATNQQSDTYIEGSTAVYTQEIKYPVDGNGPFRLVYSSDTFSMDEPGAITAILIYEINKKYEPAQQPAASNSTDVPLADAAPAPSTALVYTTMGDFTIELYDEAAPRTVENFEDLAGQGFYDGTIFHRIVPGFAIQGGDPNTISGSRDAWGSGGPGYSIEPEFGTQKHKKYVVSMARGDAIDSAGSQFFVVLDNAPWLDGQYTIFGAVTEGKDVIDKIAAIELDESYVEQPKNPADALIKEIRITS